MRYVYLTTIVDMFIHGDDPKQMWLGEKMVWTSVRCISLTYYTDLTHPSKHSFKEKVISCTNNK